MRGPFSSRLSRRINGLQSPLIPGGIEADVKVITSTTDCVAEVDGLSHPFRMYQIGRGHVIPTLVPSKRPKEGVRGPAAVDHKHIDGFAYLLEHVRTRGSVYEILNKVSTGKN